MIVVQFVISVSAILLWRVIRPDCRLQILLELGRTHVHAHARSGQVLLDLGNLILWHE
jgi:hypothetical protein